jgi:outer membrane protein TolC
MILLKTALPLAVTFQFLCAAIPGYTFTLEECVQLALKNNPDLLQQQLNLNIAHADVAEQHSRNFGKLDIAGSYTYYNLPRTLAPLTPASMASGAAEVPTTQNLFGAGIVYEVALFTGFAQTRAVEAADLQREMAGAALKLSREQLIYNIRTLYVHILSLQAQEKAQTAYVEALQRLFDDITRELAQGKKARIDQLKAAADLKNAQAGRQQITANIKISKGTLASLLNIEQVPELQHIDISPESIVVPQESFKEQLTGLQRLRVARLAADKNSKLVEQAKSARYPQLVFNTSYGLNFGPNDSSNRYSGDWEYY